MKNNFDILRGKTDAELIAIASYFATQLDLIGDEQARRSTGIRRRESDFQAGRDQSQGAAAIAAMDRQSGPRPASD